MKAHAKFGASNASRWLNCPGSMNLIPLAPEPRESVYAKEGTLAHEIFESEVRKHFKLKSAEKAPAATPEMLGFVKDAVKVVGKLAKELGEVDEILVEEKIDLSFIAPEMFGTVDLALLKEFDRLMVIDFKYGAGVSVSAEDNAQMIYYALGIAHKLHFNFETVELIILQPRAIGAEDEGSWVKRATMTVAELMEWGSIFKKGVKAALKEEAILKAGSWCQFCPAAVLCPEITKNAMAQAQIDFEPFIDEGAKLPSARDLSPKQIGAALVAANRVEDWISEVRSYAQDLLERGGEVPGFKLVQKMARRKWVDEPEVKEKAVKFFGRQALDESLLSPAQFEKKFGDLSADFLSKYCVKVSSGVTIAHESDKRPATNQAQLDFAEDYNDGKKEKEKSEKTGAKKARKKEP